VELRTQTASLGSRSANPATAFAGQCQIVVQRPATRRADDIGHVQPSQPCSISNRATSTERQGGAPSG
jgi:hypothetical protein